MYGTIVVLLWRRDVVFETFRNCPPARVDDAKCQITMLHPVNDDAKSDDVGQLLKADAVSLPMIILGSLKEYDFF